MTIPLSPGSTLEAAMLSPCVGGVVRTWTDKHVDTWSVPDDQLPSLLARGVLARTQREEGRFREAALLDRTTGTLVLQPRVRSGAAASSLTFGAPTVQLAPAGAPAASASRDLKALLATAVHHTVETNGFLVVEQGGWDAPAEPYCLFIVMQDEGGIRKSVVETAPPPTGSHLWAPHIREGERGATMSAQATDDTIDLVPTLIMAACSTWRMSPWELALTFGTR